MARFVGRERELALIKQFTEKKTASLIVVRGRRRIGKSRLIQEFAQPYTYYHFEGLPPTPETTAQMQRDEFARQLASQTGLPQIGTDDWSKLFQLLSERTQQGRVVVLFDEISWMGSEDSQFLGKIKHAWDNWFKQNDQLIFVICGSASAWIEHNILSHTGFVGRISYTLTLDELPLHECAYFCKDSNIAPFEILKVLSVTGGIPKYLEEVIPKQSAEANIRQLCFTPGGFLTNEFEQIFSDLFQRETPLYQTIVEALANGPLETKEIAKSAGFARSGRLSEYLNELELGGFITREFTWHLKTGESSKLSQYRLKDNYLRFYLKYIAPNLKSIRDNKYKMKSLAALPNWHTIMGFQFENLALNNRALIQEALQLKADDIIMDNPYFQHKTASHQACQIDYLIQAKFNTLYICEIKFKQGKIGMNVIKEMQKKIDRLSIARSMSCRPVLIHVNGVTEQLEASEFFYAIIDFSKFIKQL